MTRFSMYPPAFTVDTETGEIVAEAFNAPDDPMAMPTHRVTFRVVGTVEAVPLNPTPDDPPQEG